MKKSYLLLIGISLGLSVLAQNRTTKQMVLKNELNSPDAAGSSACLPVVRKTPLVITNTAVGDVLLGNSGNAFGGFTRPGRAILNFHPGLNALSLTHRSCGVGCASGDGTANNGYLMYDYSKDGGNTWINQQGPIYDGGGDQARYPQGFIINPSGNSNVDSAYLAVHGAMLTGAAAPWQGYSRASTKLGDFSMPCDNSVLFANTVPYRGLIPDAGCFIESTNTLWVSDASTLDGSAATDYTDTILLHKGVWNATTKCVDYTTTALPFPVISSAAAGKFMVETHITFNSTGQTGYLSAIATADITFAPDSNYYITTWKTTDGGNTWGAPNKVSMDVNTQMGTTGIKYSSGFQLDGGVDANGKLHLIFPILDWLGPFNATMGPPSGTWGLFSLITDGTANTLTLLDKPQTYRAEWGVSPNNIREDSRGQVAMSLAGDKVFYVWFDTDTTAFPGVGNKSPDAYVRYYDATSSSLDPKKNLTQGSAVDGAITFGYVADWAAGSSAPYTLHIGYQTILNSGDPTKEVQFHYLTGVTVTGVNNIENEVFSIGDAYPSPTKGTASFDLTIKKACDADFEVVNMVGQTVYSSHKKLATGAHTITVDASSWSSGMYFLTIKSDNLSITKKMVRE